MRWPSTNDRRELNHTYVQPFSQKSRTPTVAKEFQTGLYHPAEEHFCQTWRARLLRERLYPHTHTGNAGRNAAGGSGLSHWCTELTLRSDHWALPPAQPHRPSRRRVAFDGKIWLRHQRSAATCTLLGTASVDCSGGGARYGGRQVHRVTRAAQRTRTLMAAPQWCRGRFVRQQR